jgi:hypothetical protein
MTSRTVLTWWLVVLFAQIPLLFICVHLLRLDDRVIVRWNASLLIMSLVIGQVIVVWHNLRIGNVDPFFRSGFLGRCCFALCFAVMIALMVALTWFAYVCFTSPERIRSGSGVEVGRTGGADALPGGSCWLSPVPWAPDRSRYRGERPMAGCPRPAVRPTAGGRWSPDPSPARTIPCPWGPDRNGSTGRS